MFGERMQGPTTAAKGNIYREEQPTAGVFTAWYDVKDSGTFRLGSGVYLYIYTINR